MTTYITQEHIDGAIQQHADPVATYGGLCAMARAIEAAAIQAYRDSLAAGVVLPEPVHYRAVLSEAQRPQQLQTNLHFMGFRKLSSAQSFVDEQEDFQGWHYTIEALHTADQYRQGVADALAKQVPQWLPIETAPKDMGTYLFRSNKVAVQGFRDATGKLCVCIEAGASGNPPWRLMRRSPTHWMPLPAVPDPKESK